MRQNRLVVVLALMTCVFAGSAAMSLESGKANEDKADGKASAKFEVYKDRGGEFRWRLRATNTQILATSGDAYKAKRDCLHAIESVKRAAANAPVEEMVDGAAAGEREAATEGQPKTPGERAPSKAPREAN